MTSFPCKMLLFSCGHELSDFAFKTFPWALVPLDSFGNFCWNKRNGIWWIWVEGSVMSKLFPLEITNAFLTPKRHMVALIGDMTCIHLTVFSIPSSFSQFFLLKLFYSVYISLCTHTYIRKCAEQFDSKVTNTLPSETKQFRISRKETQIINAHVFYLLGYPKMSSFSFIWF